MLLMVMHKVNEQMEKGTRPSQEIIAGMGQLMGEMVRSGKMHNGAGLKGNAERVRLRQKGGDCTVQQGPLRGENELISAFTMLEVRSMDEAVAWTKRMASAIGGEVEIDLGPVTERWDLGLMDKPADAPLRVLALVKSDAASEADAKPSADQTARLAALHEEMKRTGVFLATERLKSSARGARLRTSGAKRTWVDGPFSESKELIAGFAILKDVTFAETKTFTERYAAILGDIEVDIREVEA